MKNLFLKKYLRSILLVAALSVMFSIDAYASTTGNLPFNSAIDNFKANFMSWVFGAAVVLWVATCLFMAFGEWSSGMKQIINILFWLSLAFGGASGITMLFGTGATF